MLIRLDPYYYPYYQNLYNCALSLSSSLAARPSNANCDFKDVPNDVIFNIFSYLNELDLVATAQTCCRFNILNTYYTFKVLSFKEIESQIEKLQSLFCKILESAASIQVTAYIDRRGVHYIRPATDDEIKIMRQGLWKTGRYNPQLTRSKPHLINFLSPPKNEKKVLEDSSNYFQKPAKLIDQLLAPSSAGRSERREPSFDLTKLHISVQQNTNVFFSLISLQAIRLEVKPFTIEPKRVLELRKKILEKQFQKTNRLYSILSSLVSSISLLFQTFLKKLSVI